MDTVGHLELFDTHGAKEAFLNSRICICLQKDLSKWGKLVHASQISLVAVFFLYLRINKTVFGEHQPPFSGMAARLVFSAFILYNPLFVKQFHKSDFMIAAMELSDIRRISKNCKALLDSIGVAQTGIAYKPYIDFCIHTAPPVNIQRISIPVRNSCAFLQSLDCQTSIYSLWESPRHAACTWP